MSVLVVILAGMVGLVFGGVINVLADDLPVPAAPRLPHYPDDAPRPPAAWLGITAFLTGQHSSPGGARLSWRHPVVEVLLAAIYVLMALAGPLNVERLFQMLFLAILLLITVIDLEHRLILFVVIVPSCVLAIIAAVAVAQAPDLVESLLGGVLGLVVYLAIFIGGVGFGSLMSAMRGEEIGEVAFGFGDVMLGMLSGLLLGWQAFLFGFMITLFLGAAGAVLYLLSRLVTRTGYAMFTALPYGPYIVLGTVIMMLWREEVRAFLLR